MWGVRCRDVRCKMWGAISMDLWDAGARGGSHPGKETAGRGCNASQARLTANCPARLAFTDSQPRLASPDHSQIQCQLSPASSLAVHVSADYASHLRLTQWHCLLLNFTVGLPLLSLAKNQKCFLDIFCSNSVENIARTVGGWVLQKAFETGLDGLTHFVRTTTSCTRDCGKIMS